MTWDMRKKKKRPPRFFQFYGWRQLGGNKAGRGRKHQRRECDRVVMEGWGVGGEGSKSVGGGSLEERIRKDREGSATQRPSLT